MKSDGPEEHQGLIARLQQLRQVRPRDPEAARLGKARFLAEARRSRLAASPSPSRRLTGWLESLKAKEVSVMHRRLSSAYTLVIVAAVAVALLGGTVATAYAAQGALPGSPLHPVKTGLERAQLALSQDDARVARLSLHFAERRLEELSGLIAAGRFGDLGPVASAFDAHIQSSLEALKSVSQTNPLEAQRVASAITLALSRYATLLMQFSASVPVDAQAPLLQALQASTQGFQTELIGTVRSVGSPTWQIERGDGSLVEVGVNENTEIGSGVALDAVVKVEAIEDSNGVLWAVEIELSAAEGGAGDDDVVNGNGGSEDGLEDIGEQGDVDNVDDGEAGNVDDGDVDQSDDEAVGERDDGESEDQEAGAQGDHDDEHEGEHEDEPEG
jgi:hypothetical protein